MTNPAPALAASAVLAARRTGNEDVSTGGWRFTVTESSTFAEVLADAEPVTEQAELSLADTERVECLLQAVAAATNSPVYALPLITPEEQADALEWGTGRLIEVPDLALPTIFEAVAREHANACAIKVSDPRPAERSYAQVRACAAAVSAELARLGIGRGDRVAVLLDRGPDLPGALLGVMATGAAYVPMDPGFPRDRLTLMAEDAGVAAVLTTPDFAETCPSDAPRVLLSDVLAAAAEHADQPLVISAKAADPAYVIYTSGSTGRPKGVVIGHRALVNFLLSVGEEPGIVASDVLTAVTTVSFDIAGLELFAPLLAGATVVIASRAQGSDPSALAGLLEATGTTLAQATPATWRMLVESGWTGKGDLRILCGGEAFPPELAASLLERAASVWNMYGPTETTIWSSCARVEDVDGSTPLSLGRPLANTTLAVVDRGLHDLPIDYPGELLIGGTGLADGYHGQPELTDDRFIQRDGARWYRTGDLVRRRADGRLEFLGRLDNQVKVRGFRIELGDVEAALIGVPGVAAAVAIVREDTPGDHQLVGYVRGEDAAALDPQDVRRAVTQVLPPYMVPGAVVVMETFPTTPNRKIDRKALPAPAPQSRTMADVVGPRNLMESQLVGLWEEVLGISPIGVQDNFFDLGVSSLTAARLFARIEDEFGTRLPLAPVFSAPTVEALAELLRQDRPAADVGALVPIQPQGSQPPIFGVHGGAGTVLLYAQLAQRLGRDQPFYALQAIGLYGRESPQRTIGDMATRYIAELRTVQPAGPYRLGGYCFGGLVAYEMAARLIAAGERVELVAMFNAPSPSYIARYDPVFDGDGALTDETGQRIARAQQVQRTPKQKLQQAKAAGGMRGASAEFASLAVGKVKQRTRTFRLEALIRLRRPLPPDLREGFTFQRLAAQAQDRYVAPALEVPITVYAAEGLYHQPDLGWAAHTRGPVTSVEVLGEQRIPRQSMAEPFVEAIAGDLAPRLGAVPAGHAG